MKKVCSKCKTEKDVGGFGRDRTKKDGLNSWCKECNQQKCKNTRTKYKGNNSKHDPSSFYTGELKSCYACQTEKPRTRENWNINLGCKDGICDECKKCRNKRLREYHGKNPRKKKQYRLKKYGLTLDSWERLFNGQERRCAICNTDKPSGKGWAVDHCHKTGKVRGILCSPCNHGLGLFYDNPKHLIEAARYLQGSVAGVETISPLRRLSRLGKIEKMRKRLGELRTPSYQYLQVPLPSVA